MNSKLSKSIAYRRYGYSVVIVGENKRPIHYWKHLQKHRIGLQKLKFLINHPSAVGIAIICGPISKNLEIIDIDEKNVLGESLFKKLIIKLDCVSPELVARLGIAKTRNFGFHILYTCDVVEKSTVLAKRYSTVKEQELNSKQKVRILIETRGINSYAIVNPTPGYHFIQKDLRQLPKISKSERSLIFKVARSFNQVKKTTTSFAPRELLSSSSRDPLTDFNLRGDIIELLVKHGWKIEATTPEKTKFQRPGETDHQTSGDFHHRLRLFAVFTTSSEFIAETGYNPSAVFAILECNGNFRVAAKKLLELGFGVPYKLR